MSTYCWCLLAVFLIQLAGPAGGNASDPCSSPVCLIKGRLLLLRGRGGGRGWGREETREELRQIFETCVKDKRDGGVSDSHASLSAERGSSRLSARGVGSLCLLLGLIIRFGKSAPSTRVCVFFSLFLFSLSLSVYSVISDCK